MLLREIRISLQKNTQIFLVYNKAFSPQKFFPMHLILVTKNAIDSLSAAVCFVEMMWWCMVYAELGWTEGKKRSPIDSGILWANVDIYRSILDDKN